MMTISESVEVFLQEPNFLVLGTLKKDGSIQMTPVWFVYGDGVFHVSTTTARAKYKNIRRDNRVTFVIYDLKNPYRYVQVQGEASITPDPEHELIDSLSERYRGERPYRGDPEHKEDRVIITITPKKILPQGV